MDAPNTDPNIPVALLPPEAGGTRLPGGAGARRYAPTPTAPPDWRDALSRATPRLARLARLPVPFFLAAICLLWVVDSGQPYESPRLLLGLNLVFANLASLAVAYLAGRGFAARRGPGLLLLGCGVLIWGAAGSTGVVAGILRLGPDRMDANALVTVHNVCVWIAALCLLAGVILGRRADLALRRPALWLTLGYGLSVTAVGLVVWLAMVDLFPPFMLPGQGGTPARQMVLGSAISIYVLTALLLREGQAGRSAFASWYSLALLLLAVGLLGVLLQSAPGSLLGWTGRLAQFLAGAYMLVAAAVALGESAGGGPASPGSLAYPLDLAIEPPADRAPARPLYPYFVALVLVVSAAALRLAFLEGLGMRVSYLTFYPAVALAALYGGMRAGLLAAALSALLADWFWILPAGSLAIGQSADALGMGVFFVSCALISWTAEAMHRAQARAVAAETEARFASERARTARTVQEGRDRLALGIQVSGVALADIDYGADRVRLSAEAARLYGMGHGAMTVARAAVHARFHPDDRAELERRIADCLDPAGPGRLAIDHRVVWPDGQVRWVSVRKRVVFDRSAAVPRPASAMLAAQDITERKRALEALESQAEQLREADRRKDELIAMLGHELRNPLTPILVAADMLELRGGADPDLAHWAGTTVKHQARVLTRLVNDLLDASRVTQGKIALERTGVELGALLGRALEAARPGIAERRHTLRYQPAGTPLTIEGDPVRLEQVIGNLLSNAVKYTPDGGLIQVSLAREGEWATVRVGDNGIGIAPAMLPRIFELFAQAERTLDRAQGGLGIGLALVKRLVEMHGGQVEARSPGIGLGTEVAVRLPLHPGPAAGPPDTDPAWAPDGAGREVLLVDDNADVRDSMAVLLSAMGHRVRTASSGEKALALVRAAPPDLVLLDIGMPGLDGYEVARRIRGDPAFDRVKLIAVTGYGQDEDREASLLAGFDRHLVKPVDPQALAALLAEPD